MRVTRVQSVKAAFGVLVACVATNLVLVVDDQGPNVVLVTLTVIGALAVVVLVVVSLSATPETSWVRRTQVWSAEQREDGRLEAQRWLVMGHLQAREPDSRLRDRLRRLADARLEAKYGLRLDHDPQNARRLLGPAYDELRDDAPVRRLSPRTIDELLTRIEDL